MRVEAQVRGAQLEVVDLVVTDGADEEALVEALGIETVGERRDPGGAADVHAGDARTRDPARGVRRAARCGAKTGMAHGVPRYHDPVRVLVTGGAGYIGSHLVDALCDAGHDVTVLDNLSTAGRELAHRLDEIRFVQRLDPRCRPRRQARSRRLDAVFHLAAAVGVRHIVDDPLGSLLTNTRGTENVLDRVLPPLAQGASLASTSEVYGKTAERAHVREDDDRVLGPTTVHRWSYSTAKALDEHLAFAYAKRAPRRRSSGTSTPTGLASTSVATGRSSRTSCARRWRASRSRCTATAARAAASRMSTTPCAARLLAGFTPEADGPVFNLGTEPRRRSSSWPSDGDRR